MSSVQSINHNVVKFNSSIYSDIIVFLNDKKNKSENTYRSYKRSIENFFSWVCGKGIESITESDLSIKNSVFMQYQQYLYNEKNLSSNSTNSTMGAIASLFVFLEKQEYPVKAINAKIANIKNEEDQEQAGELYAGEPEQMAQIALTHKQKGYEKYMLIKMAYITSLRISSLLNLKWNEINYDSQESIYVISTIIKGKKKHEVGITNQLYQELLELKNQSYYKDQDKIFTLSEKTIWNLMQDLNKEMRFEESRNIVFHSFRNYISNYSTLEEMKRQLGHSNIQTTERSYRHKNRNLSNMPSIRIENTTDDKIFEQMSKEQLLEMINQQSLAIKEQLKRSANEIINSNS